MDVDLRETPTTPAELARIRWRLPKGCRLKRGWDHPGAVLDVYALDEAELLHVSEHQSFRRHLAHITTRDLHVLALRRRDADSASLASTGTEALPRMLRHPPSPRLSPLWGLLSYLHLDPWVDVQERLSRLPVANAMLAGTVATWFHDGDEGIVLDLDRLEAWSSWILHHTPTPSFSP